MKIILLNLIKYFFRFFGIEISLYKNKKVDVFDKIYKNLIIEKKIIIFDIGANRGQSINRFKKIFNDASYHCFEPLSSECEKIRGKYGNSKVKINNIALSNKIEEEVDFYVNKFNETSSLFSSEPKNKNFISDRKIKIQTDTIDNYVLKNKINKINLMKIDTQGNEEKILIGAEKCLKNKIFDFIELEMIVGNIYNTEISFNNIEKLLLPNGYKFFGIDNAGNLYDNFEMLQFNLLYISESKYNYYSSSKHLNFRNKFS